MSDSVFLRHDRVASANLAPNIRRGSELYAQWYHVEKAYDVDYGNLGRELMLAHDACADSEHFVRPPFRALNDCGRHAELQELLGSLPVERIVCEEWLQELREVISFDDLDKEFLGQEITAIGQVESNGSASHSHI